MVINNLKVLLIAPIPPPDGGIASWTKQYIEWSKNNNLMVAIVNSAVIGKRAQKINYKTRIIDEVIRTNRIFKDLKYKIKQYRPHIIHLNTPCGKLGIVRDYLCARIAKNNDVKLIVHYRCNIKDQINSKFSRYILKRLSTIADLNLVLNSASMQYFLKETGIKSIQVSNFINEDFILDRSKNNRDDILTIAFVGHVQKTKGILDIYDTAMNMPNLIFKVAGPVSREICHFKKPPNLILMGPLKDDQVKELLIESDVFLFPSHTEGFSNVMLEAMAMGLPIIATPVGANVDMIENKGGVIINTGDSNSIIEAINSIKSIIVRSKMSEWNINKVKEEYTTDRVMNKLISIYFDELGQ